MSWSNCRVVRALLASSVVLVACGCGAVEVTVKPHAVSTTVATKVDTTSVCTNEPFGSSSIDFAALAKEAGLDTSNGCLKTAKIDLVAEVLSLAPGSGCTEPRGKVTLSQFDIELTCADASKQSLFVICPQPTIDVADGTDVFVKLNACLDAVEQQETDHLRRLINTCRPSVMRAFGRGSCSADTCFEASFKLTFKLLSATAQLGGTCD